MLDAHMVMQSDAPRLANVGRRADTQVPTPGYVVKRSMRCSLSYRQPIVEWSIKLL